MGTRHPWGTGGSRGIFLGGGGKGPWVQRGLLGCPGASAGPWRVQPARGEQSVIRAGSPTPTPRTRLSGVLVGHALLLLFAQRGVCRPNSSL